MDFVLTPVEARVLGSLLEKERTVPATYPLTMKALLTACNQSTSREPLMDVDEEQAEAAIEALKAHRLVRRVLPSHGNRSVKYRHVAPDVLQIDEAQRAIVTVLLLRGPQSPQELKTRSDRLHDFADAAAVEEVLRDMADWGDPLVRLLPRQSGQRDARWAHLLSGEPDLTALSEERGSARSARQTDPAPQPEAIHGALGALAGTWEGRGEGQFPTVEGFTYTERLEVIPVPGRPRLVWRVTTRAGDDGPPLHGEAGFLRPTGDNGVEMVLATGSGLVEVATGLVETTIGPDGAPRVEIVLASDIVAGTPTAKEVTATERTYRLSGTTLDYEVAMAAVGEPLQPHLSARLHRPSR